MGLGSFCLAQYDEISTIQNNFIFDFADIDRDGMIDMLFLTDKQTMNFIVHYNMLMSPSEIFESIQNNHKKDLQQSGFDSVRNQIQFSKQSICSLPNRPMEKLANIFAPYNTDLQSASTEKSEVDNTKYVLNQLLSVEPDAKEIYSEMSSDPSEVLLPRIHVGDVNSDGYPDILVTIKYNNGSSIPHVLLNQELVHTQPFTDADSELSKQEQLNKFLRVKNRFFNLNVTSNQYHEKLNKYQNVRFAVFTDMIENSMLDFMIVNQPTS